MHGLKRDIRNCHVCSDAFFLEVCDGEKLYWMQYRYRRSLESIRVKAERLRKKIEIQHEIDLSRFESEGGLVAA